MDHPVTPAGVILYGPPASGKDTITEELARLDNRYALFQRLKVGTGNTDGYRPTSSAELATLRSSHDVLYENQRYGNTYIIDRPHLAAMLTAGQIPVMHVGQVAGLRAAMRYPARWISVLLWCSRDTTGIRARARGSADVDARLKTWDETIADLQQATDEDFLVRIDTDTASPDAAARTIHSHVVSAEPRIP